MKLTHRCWNQRKRLEHYRLASAAIGYSEKIKSHSHISLLLQLTEEHYKLQKLKPEGQRIRHHNCINFQTL